jgi:signal transduction histidine kinase
MDLTVVLYVVLGLQLTHYYTRRVALAVIIAYTILLTVTQILGVGLLAGLGVSMLMIAIGAFIISGDLLYRQVRADQEDSQAMVARLQEAHRKLQESAARAEELAAARERNRLARELHDTVSQSIFSITLVARSTQLLLERDPSQVPGQLDRLQEMTGAALRQLRSLITQMRPPQ